MTDLDGASSSQRQGETASGRSSKQRTKTITVACNFCRSRKLKCDGGHPACNQCIKRSNLCDYMPQTSKRHNPRHLPKEDDESEMSCEDESAEDNDPSVSSENIVSQPLPCYNVVENRPMPGGFSFSTVAGPSEPRGGFHFVPPRPMSGVATGSWGASGGRSLLKDNDLPHIATLSLPENFPAVVMRSPPLPPIRPTSAVACNFCRVILCSAEDEVRQSASSLFQLCAEGPSMCVPTQSQRQRRE
ncbi:hypothetical protein EDB19DRAFT_98672 [Suillus lakei]|nr:hypothetical protein EDB19DRAFT_98672 [Suillus lakei]